MYGFFLWRKRDLQLMTLLLAKESKNFLVMYWLINSIQPYIVRGYLDFYILHENSGVSLPKLTFNWAMMLKSMN